MVSSGVDTKQTYLGNCFVSWDRESPNILINGDFDVWQRGTTFNLSSSTNIYTADRWRFEGNAFTGSLSNTELFSDSSKIILNYVYDITD